MEMKRCFAVLLALLLLSMGVLPVSAAEIYTLDELGISVTIPGGYAVITRDTEPDDPLFDRLGVDGQTMMSYIASSDIYLDALMEADYTQEFVVTMIEQDIWEDFSGYSDPVLEMLASVVLETYRDYGATVLDYEIYQHPQTKFIKIHFYDTANDVYGMQYYTVCGYKALNFTMRSTGRDVGFVQLSTVKSIVDGVQFQNAPQAPAVTAEAFTYTDDESGLTFTVPAGWEQGQPEEASATTDAVFTSQKEVGLSIRYGSVDAWEEMPDSDKAGYSRSDLNDSYFTVLDIADMFGVTLDKVNKVTYNGASYFQTEITGESDLLGIEAAATMTQLMYIENGWIYIFMFSGTPDSAYYSDFESLLSSAVYPDAAGLDFPTASSSDSDYAGPSVQSNSYGVLAVAVVMVLAVVLAAILAPILVVRSRKKKAAQMAAAMPPFYPGQPMSPAAPGQPGPYAPAATGQPVYSPPPAQAGDGATVSQMPPAAPASSEPLSPGAMPGAPQAGAGFVPPPVNPAQSPGAGQTANPAPPAAPGQSIAPPPPAQAGDGAAVSQTAPAPEAQSVAAPPAAAGGEAAPALICPACGSRIPPDSRFCPACGAGMAGGRNRQ